jgi:hypothetical protein
MTKKLRGTVHGRTIELAEDPGVVDGQEVELQIEVVISGQKWGDGIRRSAGGWVDYPEMDEVMRKIHQQRKLERRPQSDLE